MTSSIQQLNPTALLNLSSTPDGQKRAISCLFEGLDGKRLTIKTSERLPVSAVVSLEYNDALFMGEVMCSRSGDQGEWVVDIRVKQILTGLQSLVALRSHLLGEGVGPSVSRPKLAICA